MKPPADPFEGLRPPSPPPGLGARVLVATRLAPLRPEPWLDRLWLDRRLRFGWLTAATALLLLDWALSPPFSVTDSTMGTSSLTFAQLDAARPSGGGG